MSVFVHLVFIITSAFTLSLTSPGGANVLFFQPPILDIESVWIDINTSSTLEINCIGKHPVYWKLPDRNEIASNNSRVSIYNSIELSSESLYKTRLVLRDVGYTDTGFYSCYYDGTTDFDFRDNVTSVYVFVNDPVNLFVEKSSVLKGHMLVILQHNTKATIACLPTNSKTNVTLWKTEDEFDGGEMVSLGTDITFDPRQGFTLYYPTIYFSGLFQCRANLKQQSQHINLTLFYMPETLLEPKPFIDASEAIHPVVHGNFTLKCIVNVDPTTRVYFHWSYPNKNNSRINETATRSVMKTTRDYLHQEVVSYLIVKDVQPSDSGVYECTVTDHAKKTGSERVKVFVYASQQPTHVNFTTDMDISRPVVYQVGKDVQFVIFVHAYPSTMDVVLYWLKDGELYPSDSQFQLKTTGNTVKLEISNLSREDAGVYTLVGKTPDTVNNISIILDVEDKPIVRVLNSTTTYMRGTDYVLECRADGVPSPVVWWRWKPCEQVKNCQAGEDLGWKNVEENSVFPNRDQVTSRLYGARNHTAIAFLRVTANKSGHYLCSASNVMGQEQEIVSFIVTDAKGGFEIRASNSRPVEKDAVTVTCKASTFNHSSVQWEWIPLHRNSRPMPVSNTTDMQVRSLSTEYSHTSTINFRAIQLHDSGTYRCKAIKNFVNDSLVSSITILVQGIQHPVVNSTNMEGGTIVTSPGKFHEFFCYMEGIPEPRVSWLKDGRDFDVSNMSGVELADGNRRLILKRVLEKDSGFYECVAENRGGSARTNATLSVISDDAIFMKTGLSTSEIATIISFVSFGIVFLALTFYLVKRNREERKQKKEQDFLNQSLFERGYVDIFNPSLPLQDQVDLLPYKHQWEFPKERLKLGKTLGQGAFGRVVKAEAIGLVDGEPSTTVAVKMLKETANSEQKKALVAELKILIHLGRHLNILNLLGAVTKNLAKGELMVIVEYCCYGNLRHFLLKHKRSYLDQVDPETGMLDPNRLGNPESPYMRAKSPVHYANIVGLGMDNPSYRSYFLHYADLSHRRRDSGTSGLVASPSERYLSDPQPHPTKESETDADFVLTTCNLLCYAFQCARGMEYLASKKFIHRDLAARNVLLAKDNVVKICDFGLAKDCYKYSNYVKKTDGLVPIKWMAIESICDRVFTTKSDVWSFGVLLWEMFTLGGNPYPGLEVNDEFVKRLKSGYRMEKPDIAPTCIYEIMKECWSGDPTLRPDFNQLSERIGSFLEAGVRKYYVELNEPYQMMNSELLNNNEYLQMGDTDITGYTKMDNGLASYQNAYDNITSMRPVGNGPVPKVPMEVVPMIQLESLSWSEPQVRKNLPQRSLSLENIPWNCQNMQEEHEHSRSDDDDSVFLEGTVSSKQPKYLNGHLERMHELEMSTRC